MFLALQENWECVQILNESTQRNSIVPTYFRNIESGIEKDLFIPLENK